MTPPPPALGIDLGGTKIEVAALDAGGQVLWRERIPTPAGDYGATLAAVTALVGRAERALGGPFTVGVGHPGALTPQGRIKNANSTCLNGQALAQDLQDALGRPVRLANDANCLALSEAHDGAAAGASVVFAVILGTGSGGGIAVHGRVLAGANGLAGEWAHNPLPWPTDAEQPGPRCYCGRSGCIETWVSGPGLAADHRRSSGATLDGPAIVAAAQAGDAAAGASLARHADRLARALAGVVNLLDPDVIVFGGGLSALPGLVEGLPVAVAPWVFSAGSDAPLSTRFVRAAHGDASGVRGAAWLWR